MKTVPLSPEKVNVWLEPALPGVTKARGSNRRRPPAQLLDHPDSRYKHKRVALSPLSPAGVKPGSPEAQTGCKQARALKGKRHLWGEF